MTSGARCDEPGRPELTLDPLIDTVAEFGTAVGDAVGKDYNVANSRAERFLRTYATERIDGINSTTREAVREALRADDPRAAVREVFRQARGTRAQLIAETEVVRASNWAAIDAGKWVGALDRKAWASQRDAAVRHEHAGLHGQVVEWNGKFTSPGGYTGPGPGSMSGGAAMNVNCRCSAVPAGPKSGELKDDFVALYDDLRSPMVQQLAAKWRRVFSEQEAAVLAELED